ncbi:MAG: RNA methyltransferase [Desulforegulaceae bacterium]|nr:RNA methyltransferase [Desulforegulaceae bacterium]
MKDKNLFDNVSIVLVRPKYSANIGSSARAMKNMGFTKLIVVNPLDYEKEKAKKLSTHAAQDILENAVFTDNLDLVLKDFNFCIGTTARLGRQRNLSMSTPYQMAQNIKNLISNNKIAILFGPENKGLENLELKKCHRLLTIDTEEFSSLNLSQAVMIVTYEISKALKKQPEDFHIPTLANRFELDSMYEHLKDILMKIDFIHPENPDHWLDNFRTFFSRQDMRAKDVNILRGVLRQIEWYGNYMYELGKNPVKDQD